MSGGKCCGQSADVDDQDGGHQYDPSHRGPNVNRSCTDVLCLLLFVAFLAGWVVVAVWAFSQGNPLLLMNPSNSDGQICGRGSELGKPFLLFFDLTKCFSLPAVVGCPTRQICVQNCPSEHYTPYKDLSFGLDIVSIKRKMQPFCGPEMTEAMIQDGSVTPAALMYNRICPSYVVKSGPVAGRCLPFVSAANSSTDGAVFEQVPEVTLTYKKLKSALNTLVDILDLRNVGEKVLSDLAGSWWIVLLGLAIASVLSLLWIILMRVMAKVMVWTSLLLSLCLMLLSCIFCGFKWAELQRSGADHLSQLDLTLQLPSYLNLSTTWLIFLILSAVAFIVMLILLVACWSRIKLAIEMIDEASVALGGMLSTLFFPIVPFILQILLVAWFIAVAVCLASTGHQQFQVDIDYAACQRECTAPDLSKWKYGDECRNETFTPFRCAECGNREVRCLFYKYGPTDAANWLHFYNIFGLFWGMFFLSALDEMVLAGAFAAWYWTMDKSKVPRLPLLSSCGRTLRYHMGTLAFGALIISVVRMIRVMIEYVENKLKQHQPDNVVVKSVGCMCKCCFWCLENVIKFINRNAFIMTAVYGKNFCSSAKTAFNLLFRNMLRAAVLDKVTDYVLFMAKLVIVGGVGVASFYVFSGRIRGLQENNELMPHLNYYFIPVILITLGSYFIADVFFGVYEMGVDTLFLCVLQDSEINDGSPEKPYFMSQDLRNVLHKMNRSPAKESESI